MKNLNLEEKNNLNSKIYFTLLNIINEYGKYNLCTNHLIRVQTAKNIYAFSLAIFNEIDSIIKKDTLNAKSILSGDFSINNNQSIPLFVILDFMRLCCESVNLSIDDENRKMMKEVTEYTRKISTSKVFNRNLHINDKILPLISSGELAIETFATRAVHEENGKMASYNSTIATCNRILSIESDEENMGDISYLRDEDEKMLVESGSKNLDLVCEPIFVLRDTRLNLGNSSQEKIVPLFVEQEADLFSKYNNLYNFVMNKKQLEVSKQFRHHVLPYFKDTTFREFILLEEIPWNEIEELGEFAHVLERMYYLVSSYCNHNDASIDSSMRDFNFLNAVNIEIQDVMISEQNAKKSVIECLVNHFKSKSFISKNLFGMRRIPRENIEKKLSCLTLIQLVCIKNKVESNILGCKDVINYVKAYE